MFVHVVVPVDIGETVASVTESWSDRACDLLGGFLEEVFSTNACARLVRLSSDLMSSNAERTLTAWAAEGSKRTKVRWLGGGNRL